MASLLFRAMARQVLIATMPRSGTWYNHLFLWSYDWLLRHKWRHAITGVRPSIVDDVLYGGALDKTHKLTNKKDYRKTLGSDLYICHSRCPGYDPAEDQFGGEWNKIKFSLPYDSHDVFLKGVDLDPANNPDARIVYMHRNPLDHFISYFRVTQAHKWAEAPRSKIVDGAEVRVSDLHDWVFNASALESYLKQFHTFRIMAERYPANVLMVPYERFSSDPKAGFLQILAHIGAPVDGPLKRRAFETAFAMTAKGTLMDIEKKMGRSLGNELNGDEKHIGDGGTGRWINRFSDIELAMIEHEFARFGHSLADFQTRHPL